MAAAKSGFGLYGGIASHSDSGTFNSTTFLSGQTFSYSSAGISVGLDYQIALGDMVSLNPFLQSSSEGTSGNLKPGVTAGHGVLGLELRLWLGNTFLGGHVASYSEVLLDSSGSNLNATSSGAGGSLGWEGDDGVMVVLQVDSFKLSYSDADVDVTAARVHVGYRWK